MARKSLYRIMLDKSSDEVIHIRIPRDLKHRVLRRARNDGVTTTWIVRRLLEREFGAKESEHAGQ